MVTFSLIFWGCIIFVIVRGYRKMNSDDRKSVINDLKRVDFILTIGFLVIGAFLATLASAFTVAYLKVIGIIFFCIGGVISFIMMWKVNKLKSIYILTFTILAVYFLN